MTPSLAILPEPPAPPAPVGVIAGGGRLPELVVRSLRDRGHVVHGLGLARQYERELPALCDTFREVPLLRIGRWARMLRTSNTRHAIMVGRVDKAKIMHDPWRMMRNIPDFRTLRAWYSQLKNDRRSHTILAAIADELDRFGVSLMDSTVPIPEQLAQPGVMTRTTPTKEQQADIDFAWPLLSEMLRLDIGQAVTVRERDVLAVEAVEGTDKVISRTGGLCRRGGWTLCKGARLWHDRRSDVPTVGPRTLELMKEHGGRCLALAASDVIMIDREKMIDRADQLGIAIVGVPVARSAIYETKPSPMAARPWPSGTAHPDTPQPGAVHHAD
ncbi:MAG: UDP-2,3-diacylglucosamine diphosphatase LpxI [Planctomycetota bacterium]